ncbi:MAG: cobalamin B12-binding domain-containing protein [Gemmatimonadetes bacterium]|nr:cobalamin B12-binding domain-containing protein [Gemmatimonadota bacterium]
MEQVGEGWARGELPIRGERAASREVSETIYALLDQATSGARTPARPTAVVATVEPDQHVLGSLLVRLMLVQRGWRVEHLGTGLPVAEIVAAQKAAGASLVCVSFTPPRGSADVRRFVDVAGRLADPCSPYSLALGGGGVRGVDLCGCEWPFGAPAVLDSLAEFGQWLDRHADLPTPPIPAATDSHA